MAQKSRGIRKEGRIRPRDPMALPAHDYSALMALKGIAAGTADESQQKYFMLWLMRDVCKIGGLSFVPGNDGTKDFLEGQRSIAIILQHFIEESVSSIRKRLNLNINTEES